MENRLYENRQCLDYLGDNDEYSPSQICKKSSSDIETKLKSIRLRHCCERDVLSALHNEAYVDVLNGGAGCIKRLDDLVEADSLAARITCEFMEILVRYDCGSRYSLIHHCGDCKVSTKKIFYLNSFRLYLRIFHLMGNLISLVFVPLSKSIQVKRKPVESFLV